MDYSVPFFNWSLNRVLETETDSLNRARIKIVFVMLSFATIKLLVALPIVIQHEQNDQLIRILGLLVIETVMLKLLLANKLYIKPVTHVLLWSGLFVVWSNILFFSATVNLVTVQFIFMLVLCSSYLLEKGFAIMYACLSILPACFVVLGGNRHLFTETQNELASPGYEIIVVLNFITIVIAHYLFQRAFITTIHEKEALNTQLQFAVQDANRASESKSDFLSTMSHELRTPLNSVIGISELLLTESKNDEQIENLRILKFSAENLHSLINDILDYNKLDSEKLHLEAISVDLYELINNVSSGLRFQAKQKGIDFILEVDKVIAEHRVITDPTRIAQIIYNLVGNAIKFTENGSVTIRVEIASEDTDILNLQFAVIDTGIGISADKQAAIFEPFTQASSSTTRKFGGTGLGLAIVKRLLSMFNSNINLESIPGKGSTFSFAIAFKRDKENVLKPDTNSEMAYDLSDLKILVAEDNQMNRLLLTKVLARWNNSPAFALNGLEAVEKVAENNYDVVLMDLHMPLMNGYEATKAIRDIADPVKSEIRIIALTASVSSNLNNKINEVGMDGYIQKPFKLDDLYKKLKSIPVSI